MRISDWSSDVCSSDLEVADPRVDLADRCIHLGAVGAEAVPGGIDDVEIKGDEGGPDIGRAPQPVEHGVDPLRARPMLVEALPVHRPRVVRSEEHTSELQSLMRISFAVFCLKKKHSGTQQS